MEEVLVQRQSQVSEQVRLGLVWPLRTCRVCGLSSDGSKGAVL